MDNWPSVLPYIISPSYDHISRSNYAPLVIHVDRYACIWLVYYYVQSTCTCVVAFTHLLHFIGPQ